MKLRTKYSITICLAFCLVSGSANAVFWWAIVDPAKTGTIIQRIAQSALEHAQRLAFAEIEKELKLKILAKFTQNQFQLTANTIARVTQNETDLQNRKLDARLDPNPHVCGHMDASQLLGDSNDQHREFVNLTQSKLDQTYTNKFAKTDVSDRIIERNAETLLVSENEEYAAEDSMEFGMLVSKINDETPFTKFDYSNTSDSSKMKHLDNLRERTLSQASALKISRIHQELNDPNSQMNAVINDANNYFSGTSSLSLLEYTLNTNGGGNNSSALHGLLSELAITKAKKIHNEFNHYLKDLENESEKAIQLVNLGIILNQ